MISEEKIRSLPSEPGVYQFFDDDGELLYVGKAKSLRNRVASYFRQQVYGKTRALVKRITEVKTIVVNSELDALLLENTLIKTNQPRYNINLKDDKTYPYICIKNERFPRIFPTRSRIEDGSEYFGPYASVKAMKSVLMLAREIYPLRTCRLDLNENAIESGKYKVCLEFHLGNCKAPCVGLQTEADYLEGVHSIREIIRGNLREVRQLLLTQMERYSADLQFEKAALAKDKLTLLTKYQSKSTVITETQEPLDVLNLTQDSRTSFVNYMKVADGALVRSFTLEMKQVLDESPEEILASALAEINNTYGALAPTVLVPQIPDVEWPGVRFIIPQRGEKKKLLELSEQNARFYMLEKHKQERITNPERSAQRILEQVQRDLRLKELPVHIECFDNSNFQGTNAVAACVVFKNARPSKKDYRHFNIQTVEGPDDFASMREVVHRRYARLLKENEPLPQLVVIDGGKGQLSSAVSALEGLNLRGKIPVIGIAKRLEEIYFPGDTAPIYIDKRSESLKLIQQLRNEAHRFGITHHRGKRSKAAIGSALHGVDGIGPKTAEDLLKHFKSMARVKAATEEELAAVVGPAKAKKLVVHFSANAQKTHES